MSRRTALRPGLVAALPKEEGRTLVGQIGRSGKHVIYHCSPSAALCTVIVLIIAPNAIPKKQREALLHQPSQILAYTLHCKWSSPILGCLFIAAIGITTILGFVQGL